MFFILIHDFPYTQFRTNRVKISQIKAEFKLKPHRPEFINQLYCIIFQLFMQHTLQNLSLSSKWHILCITLNAAPFLNLSQVFPKEDKNEKHLNY